MRSLIECVLIECVLTQDKYWFKPTQHMYLVLVILACCMPFLSVGICSRFFPDRLESFPKSYYKVCVYVCMYACMP